MRAKPPTGREARSQRAGTQRTRALRHAAVLAALLLPTAAACGIQPTGITLLGSAPAALGASPAQSLDTSPGSTQYLVYFYQGDRLTPAYRSTKGEVTETAVYTALLSGPDPAEQAAGFFSAMPPGLVVKARAADELGAYNLSEPLGQRAKAQFICTMQYYDQLDSIGIQVGQTRPFWNACQDTTNQFIPMRGDGTVIPSPGATGN